MKQTSISILLVLLFFLTQKSFGQTPRFNAGLIAGLNFSELEGNDIVDYYGLNAGIFGSTRLSKNTQIGIEFLFSQNGEYIDPEFYPQIEYGKVWLNHLEIPVHIDWLLESFKRNKKQVFNLNAGIAYTRIFSYFAEDLNQVEVTDQIIYDKRDAFLWQTGLVYNFTQRMGLNLKSSFPLRKGGLVSLTLAARLIYTLR